MDRRMIFMNIFVFDRDLQTNVKMYCASHTSKMLLETAQLLSTAYRVLTNQLEDENIGVYKLNHLNHPCSKWARASYGNYTFLLELFYSLHDEWNHKFRDIASRYREGLSDLVTTPQDKSHEYAVYHNFVIYVDERDQLMEHLAENGVETKIHYPVLLHLQPSASCLGYENDDFPVAESLASQMLSLPIYPELEEQEIDHVIAMVRSYYG